MALMKMPCAVGSGGIYELDYNEYNVGKNTFSYSGKLGKKLILTLYAVDGMGQLTNDFAKIDTSTLNGGNITSEYVNVSNQYVCGRCYEIDITSNSLSFSLVTSSAAYSAVFV